MAKITLDVKDTTKEKLMIAVRKSELTLKDYVLAKLGVKDE